MKNYKKILVIVYCLIHYNYGYCIADTTFLLKNERQKIFIDTAKNSIGYKMLLDDLPKDILFDSLNKLDTSKWSSNKINHLTSSIQSWSKIVKYKNNFYAYRPCDFLYAYQIAFDNNYFFDHPDLYTLNKVKSLTKINKNHFKVSITTMDNMEKDFDFKIINEKMQIAMVKIKLEDGRVKNEFMIKTTHLKKLPIIINMCTEKSEEFDF